MISALKKSWVKICIFKPKLAFIPQLIQEGGKKNVQKRTQTWKLGFGCYFYYRFPNH